jgi:hypothetical protein
LVLLVGGPGNGKTEAVEATIEALDRALRCSGALKEKLAAQLLPRPGLGVPRKAVASAAHSSADGRSLSITIVQDASVEESPAQSRGELLAGELEAALGDDGSSWRVYLACVNRGVLDDAMIHVADNGPERARELILAVTRAVAQGGSEVSCWPLDGHPTVAVWPMDVESLFTPTPDGDPTPAVEVLSKALDEAKWPPYGTCAAGEMCPFCTSRRILAGPRGAFELLQVLRWHELAASKRWTFRDFFSLVSFLLSGWQGEANAGAAQSPCSSAANLVELDAERLGQRPDPRRSTAIFALATSVYQHQLVGTWDAGVARRLREDIREVGLSDDHTAMGFYHFLRNSNAGRRPEMIAALLESLSAALDPALADPDSEMPVNGDTKLRLREIDARFSQSVGAGSAYLARYRCYSKAESELLARLAELDRQLSTPARRRSRPEAATRIQHGVRDFACRLTRRSLGVRSAVTRDAHMLVQFQGIVETPDPRDMPLREAAREVANLLNKDDKFQVSLTTTFGQPAAPANLRAVLVTTRQPVKPHVERPLARPKAPIRQLRVGKGNCELSMPLTFELYRSVRLLSAGLSRAALPTEVNALIDSMKARLAGPVVRDQDNLDGSIIELGAYGTSIEVLDGGFLPTAGRAAQ